MEFRRVRREANSDELVVGLNGLGPSTSRLSGGCSNQLSYKPIRCVPRLILTFGGDEGVRTPDPLLAGQVLSQLSYTPKFLWVFQGIFRSLRTEYSRRLVSGLSNLNFAPLFYFTYFGSSLALFSELSGKRT